MKNSCSELIQTIFTFLDRSLLRGLLALIPLFEGVAVTLFVTDGVVAFELDFQFAKSKLKNDYPVCSTKRCIHPFKEGEFYFQNQNHRRTKRNFEIKV